MPLPSRPAMQRVGAALAAALALVQLPAAPAAHAVADNLVQPRTIIAERARPSAKQAAAILAARRYASFWNTGDEALARAALAPEFADRTLPPGRAQGVEGPLAASALVRAAVPDMRCDIEQLIVAGDRVVVHLHFHGHFSGRFKDRQGQGQPVDFIATDIYRVVNGKIIENWHIEDNLALLQQVGSAAR
jgi:predicted ester cyclase